MRQRSEANRPIVGIAKISATGKVRKWQFDKYLIY